MSTLFVRQGEDTVVNTNDLLELVISELQEKHNILHSHYSQLGKGFEKTIKPWALVFCKNIEDIEKTFHEESQEAEQKTWLDLIRICRVETAHQLRAVLCGIHIKPNTIGEEIDILRWIEEEKNGQPPSIVVVIDLFDLMLSNKSDNEYAETLRYLSINFNELSHLLLNLVETCNFLNKGRLPHEEDIREANEIGFTKRVYHIIAYYIENII